MRFQWKITTGIVYIISIQLILSVKGDIELKERSIESINERANNENQFRVTGMTYVGGGETENIDEIDVSQEDNSI